MAVTDSGRITRMLRPQNADYALRGYRPGMAFRRRISAGYGRWAAPVVLGREAGRVVAAVREVVLWLARRQFGGQVAGEVGDDLSGDGVECGEFLGG
jgi:hypothetical protein